MNEINCRALRCANEVRNFQSVRLLWRHILNTFPVTVWQRLIFSKIWTCLAKLQIAMKTELWMDGVQNECGTGASAIEHRRGAFRDALSPSYWFIAHEWLNFLYNSTIGCDSWRRFLSAYQPLSARCQKHVISSRFCIVTIVIYPQESDGFSVLCAACAHSLQYNGDASANKVR